MMPFRAEVRSNVERLPDSQPRNATAEPFLVKDYELKVQYLTNHLSRMWTRFNYFVTIESALLGGKVAFGDGKLSPQLVVLGFFVSVIWYVMGAEDRYLVKVYREHVRAAAERLASVQWKEPSAYTHVGEIELTSRAVSMDVAGWRLRPVSTTRLAALIPLGAGLMWAFAAVRLL